ncbi:hypothetical protein LF1_53150 [Rubripirellula obstinata]|uniref:Uncharacterized protein n=1 Tax=Rubripirellula obstinata TaxID=406547 RepID=A0A5B1CAB0_9BACT|nr:hypothetical protein LF1_53150 [Rubripirellula obstinata]
MATFRRCFPLARGALAASRRCFPLPRHNARLKTRITMRCTGVRVVASLCKFKLVRPYPVIATVIRLSRGHLMPVSRPPGHNLRLDWLLVQLLQRLALLYLFATELPDRYSGPPWSIPTVARVAGHRRGGTPAIHDPTLVMVRSPIPKTFTAIQDLFMRRRPVDVSCFAGYARSNVAASRRCFLLEQVMLVSHRCFSTACTHCCDSCMTLISIVSHADG